MFFRILDLEENEARATDLNHYLYSHLQVEEPGGGASKEGGEDLGHGHGAEGSGTGDYMSPLSMLLLLYWCCYVVVSVLLLLLL